MIDPFKGFTQKHVLITHIRTMHTEEAKKNPEILEALLVRSGHPGRPKMYKPEIFKCEYEGCDYETKWPANMTMHTRTHTGTGLNGFFTESGRFTENSESSENKVLTLQRGKAVQMSFMLEGLCSKTDFDFSYQKIAY